MIEAQLEIIRQIKDRNERDKAIVYTKCARCGKPLEIKYGSYRRNKDPNHYCKKCNGEREKERIASLSDEEREAFRKKKSESVKAGWANQSEEMKQKVSKMRKEDWKKESRQKIQAELLRRRWDNATDAEKQAQAEKLGKGRDKFWGNEENRKIYSELARERWYQYPEEIRAKVLAAAKEGSTNYWNNLSDEEKQRAIEKRSASSKKYWANLSQEDRDKHFKRISNSLIEYFNNLDRFPNKNEAAFIDYLNKNNLKFDRNYMNTTKHPDFDKLFAINEVKPGSMVLWFHKWDFIIYGIDTKVLVDIDGSIHDPKSSANMVHDKQGNFFKLSDYIEFKDAQRPYQTDGLEAYVIQCYDDNLIDKTPVTRITTGEKMNVKQLISILAWNNMTDAERKSIIKNI